MRSSVVVFIIEEIQKQVSAVEVEVIATAAAGLKIEFIAFNNSLGLWAFL